MNACAKKWKWLANDIFNLTRVVLIVEVLFTMSEIAVYLIYCKFYIQCFILILRCYFIFYQFPLLFWHFQYCNRKLLTTYHSTKSVTYLLVNIHHDHLLKCFIQYNANRKPHFSFCVSRELFFFWSFYCITFRSYKGNIFLISWNLSYSRLISIIWHWHIFMIRYYGVPTSKSSNDIFYN